MITTSGLPLSKPFYFLVAVLLLFVFVIGGERFGAARWLEAGLVTIQPAELAKIAIILTLASFFSANIERINNWMTIGRSLALTAGIVVWILLQPNLSTSIVIFVIWATMLWISGLESKYILIMIGIVIVFLVISFMLDFLTWRTIRRRESRTLFNQMKTPAMVRLIMLSKP